MKKLITLVLTVTIILCFNTAVFATGTTIFTSSNNDDSHGIFVTYQGGAVDKYCVDILWGDMTFEYTAEVKGQWDYEHGIVGCSPATWTPLSDNTITIVNHSSRDITVEFEFVGTSDVDGSFSDDKVFLPTAQGTTVENAPTETISFMVTNGVIFENMQIGTITAKLIIEE